MAKHCLSFWVTTVFSFITGIWLLTTLIMFDKSENVENGNCLIDNVQYTQNISDTQNMVRCDCGRNCKSDEGMCIKIYVLMDNITYMAGSDLHESINTCTFQEEMCKKKHDMTHLSIHKILQIRIYESQKIMKQFHAIYTMEMSIWIIHLIWIL